MRKSVYIIALFFITHIAFAQPNIGLQTIATGFSSPVCITNAGDDRLFIVEQTGVIKILHSDGVITTFMNIDARVGGSGGSEQGLLGLAFHPEYATNGYFYVNYTNNSGNTRISRFSVNVSNPDLGDDATELILKTINQPFSNHNGGDLAFGPDGYLYVGMGDGGSGGDPGNRAQDTTSQLLGKMLRLDVDAVSPYIPADNPYVGISGDDEIWAYGLRNPWRFSFDRLTGDLYIGDVGQGSWEEVDFQPASSDGGENYGWRCYEGNHEYNTSLCDLSDSYVFPIHEYDHSYASGGYAITGGFVYRGSEFAGMYGWYVVCDYVTGNFWVMKPDGLGGWTKNFQSSVQSDISSFGEDVNGELYACNLSSGVIYHVIDENCGAVWGVEITGITSTTATISWEPVGSTSYKLLYRKSGSPWTTLSTVSTSINLTGLTPSSNYSFRIRNKCAGIPGLFTKNGSFITPAFREGELNQAASATLISNNADASFIILTTDQNIHLQIMSISGAIIFEKLFCNSGDIIQLENATPGIYIAVFISDSKKINSQKLIIQ